MLVKGGGEMLYGRGLMLCGGVCKCCAVLCGSVCTLLWGVCKLCGWPCHVCMDGTTCRSSFAGNLPVSDAYEQGQKGCMSEFQ